MTSIDGVKEHNIAPLYDYCCTNSLSIVYPQHPSYYRAGDGILWAYTEDGNYYTTYWGKPAERVRYSANLSFYKTLPLKVEEKHNTYMITYYKFNANFFVFNDISILESYKTLIELNKYEITKIEYLNEY